MIVCDGGHTSGVHRGLHATNEVERKTEKSSPRRVAQAFIFKNPPGVPGSPFCWANLGLTEWWKSNQNGRPEIVSRKCSVGRPNLPLPRLPSKKRTGTGVPDE